MEHVKHRSVFSAALIALACALALIFAPTAWAATAITPGEEAEASLDDDGLAEFSLTVDETGYYLVDPSLDVWVSIYDADGDYVEVGIFYGGYQFLTYLEAGSYTIEVEDELGEYEGMSVALSVEQLELQTVTSGQTVAIASNTVYLFTPTDSARYDLTVSATFNSSDEEADFYASAFLRSYDIEDDYTSAYAYVWAESTSDSDTGSSVLTAGETYAIAAYASDSSLGSATFTIAETEITDITQADGSGSYSTDTASYGTSYLSFTPSTSGAYTFTLSIASEPESDSIYVDSFAVLRDAEDSYLDEIDTAIWYEDDGDDASDDDSAVVILAAGETYYVELWVYGEDDVDVSLEVTLVETEVTDITQSDGSGSYSSTSAGTVLVSYTPSASGTYTVELALTADYSDDEEVIAYASADVLDVSGEYISWDELYVYYEYYEYDDDSTNESYESDTVTIELTAGETYYFELWAQNYVTYGEISYSLTVMAEDVECTHDYVATETVDATCTEDGYVVYTCSICGDTYTEVLDALGHDYVAVVTDPTCEEGGYTTYTCSRCDDSYVADETEATGHDYQISETTATCTEAGTTVYVCANDSSHTYTVEAEALGHDYVLVETTATCTEAGTSTYTCSRCGDTYTEEVDALGHDYEATVTDPTCTEDGYTTYTCSVCGDTYVSDYVDALGHSYEAVVTDPTCEEDGYTTYTCSVCGDTYTDDVVAALGHAYDEGVYTDPTCTEDGYTTYTCANDASHTYTVTDEGTATGHSYGEAEWVFYYTVSSDGAVTFTRGLATFTCTVCGATYQDVTTDLTVVENEDGSYTVSGTVTGPDGEAVTGTVTDTIEIETGTGTTESTDDSEDADEDEDDEESLASTGDGSSLFAGIAAAGALALAAGLAARKRRNVA